MGKSTQGSGGQFEALPCLTLARVPGDGGEADRSRWRGCLCIGWGPQMHVQYKLGVSEASDGSSRESRDPGANAFLWFGCNRLSPLRPQEVA